MDDNVRQKLLSNAFCICFTGKKYRADALMRELERVGIKDPHIIWTFPSPYRDFLLKRIPHIDELDKYPGAWGATLGNYFAIKTAHELGMNHVLVMEDDCRFVKDLGKLDAALGEIPEKWDILMLDHFVDEGVKKHNDYWSVCSSAKSTACYIINRRAMERLIDMYESPVSGKYPHPMMRNSDHWQRSGYLGDDIRIFIATPNLAIQQFCNDDSNFNPNGGGNDRQMRLYRGMKVDVGMYHDFL